MESGTRALGLADVAVALVVTLAVVGVGTLADPEARANLLSRPGVREVFCADDATIELTTSAGGSLLKVPEGGVAVRVLAGEEPVPSRLTLFRHPPGWDWYAHWSLDAPSGKEIFYVANVAAGEEAYVLAEPLDKDVCPVRSATMRAPSP